MGVSKTWQAARDWCTSMSNMTLVTVYSAYHMTKLRWAAGAGGSVMRLAVLVCHRLHTQRGLHPVAALTRSLSC